MLLRFFDRKPILSRILRSNDEIDVIDRSKTVGDDAESRIGVRTEIREQREKSQRRRGETQRAGDIQNGD